MRTVVLALICLLLCSSLSACNSEHKEAAPQPPSENVVPVSAESAAELDLKTETVSHRALSTALHVTGRIQAEVAKEIDVSPRFTGRVVGLKVLAGDHVKAGQTLALVDSQEVSQLQAELIEAQSKYEIAKAHLERERQIYNENMLRPKDLLGAKSDYEQLKVQVQLAEAEFNRTSDLYKEKIAAAKDLQAAKAMLAQLQVKLAQSEQTLKREQDLFKNKALLRRDVQLASAEAERERQHVETLKQRLILLGVPKPMVSQVVATGHIIPSIPVISPSAGVVTEQRAAVGEIVSPDKRMMLVTDLSTVVMSAEVPEVDVSQVRFGAPVEIKVAAFPKERFNGTISYVSDVVNPATRTVAIRASLANPQRKLKTNMFAEINLPGAPVEVLSLPKAAIQERGGSKVVYVATTGGYKEYKVEVGRDFGEYVEVASGVSEGDRVATQGSLLLRTALANKQMQQQ